MFISGISREYPSIPVCASRIAVARNQIILYEKLFISAGHLLRRQRQYQRHIFMKYYKYYSITIINHYYGSREIIL